MNTTLGNQAPVENFRRAALAWSPSRASSFSQASRMQAVIEAVSQVALILKSWEGKWPRPVSLPVRIVPTRSQDDLRRGHTSPGNVFLLAAGTGPGTGHPVERCVVTPMLLGGIAEAP